MEKEQGNEMIKSFFRQCRNELRELRIMTERAEWLRASLLPAAIRYKSVDVQTSGSGDQIGDVMPEVAELDEAIREQIATLTQHQYKAQCIINGLDDTRYRQLLTLYYLDARLLTWDQVAEEMAYELGSIYNLHGDALAAAEKAQVMK